MADRRSARIVDVGLALAGAALLGLAFLGDVVRHQPFDFGAHQQECALVGALLLGEGWLRLRTGESNALWRLLVSDRPAGFLLGLALGLALLGIQLAAFRGVFVDDAFITFRYAQHVAHGLGFVWNPGERPVEGYTNFLWMLMSAAAERAGADPMIVSRVAGGILLVVGLFAVRALAVTVTGTKQWANLTIPLLAAIPAFSYWAMSGLETISVSTLSLLYFLAFHREFPSRRWPWWTAFCADLLWLSRPDPAMVLLLSALPLLVTQDRRSREWVLRLALLALPAVVLYQGWKFALYGRPLPNTVAAKWSPFAGLPMVMNDFQMAFPLLLLALLGASCRATLFQKQMLVVASGLLLALINVRPQMGHFGRHFLVVLAPLCALLPITLARWQRDGAMPAPGGIPAAAYGLLLLLAGAPFGPMEQYAQREIAGYRSAQIPLAAELKKEYPPEALVAASDCGLLPYWSGLRTLDLWGLTDRHIAERGFDADYVLHARPDAIVLNSVDREVFRGREAYDVALYPAMEGAGYRLRQTYPAYGYWLWLFTRDTAAVAN